MAIWKHWETGNPAWFTALDSACTFAIVCFLCAVWGFVVLGGWVGVCVCVCVWIVISVISSVVCCWHVGSSHAHACWRLCPARPQQTATWISPSCSGPASTSGRTPHAAHWHGPDPFRSLLRPARWAHGSPCQGALLCGPSAVFCLPEKNVSLTCLLICSFICCWAPWSSAASGDCAPTCGETVL